MKHLFLVFCLFTFALISCDKENHTKSEILGVYKNDTTDFRLYYTGYYEVEELCLRMVNSGGEKYSDTATLQYEVIDIRISEESNQLVIGRFSVPLDALTGKQEMGFIPEGYSYYDHEFKNDTIVQSFTSGDPIVSFHCTLQGEKLR